MSAGGRLRQALELERPLQVVGVINAYAAMMAERVGFKALYLSGAGVANYQYGLPDLGLTTVGEVIEEARRVTSVTDLPLLVDADTGFGGAFMIGRAVKEMTAAGVAGIHIEDQVQAKRCGHRPGKVLVEAGEMCDRIGSAVDAKTDPEFVVMARTDALAVEDLGGMLERARRYEEAGADMIFAEAITELDEYREISASVNVPVLANITEFGVTPLFTTQELAGAGVDLALYPLSAARAMSAAALNVYETLRRDGTQRRAIGGMQPRDELYDFLRYHEYEEKLDRLFDGGREA